MPVDATIVPNSQRAAIQQRILTQESNMQTVRLTDFTGGAHLDRLPEYCLYDFNIAPRAFNRNRPPCFPNISLAPCPAGQPYAKVGKFPDIVDEKWIDADSGEVRVKGIKGERFVMDLINPSNLGIEMWREITDEQMTWVDGGTNDYTRRGLFWTRNEEP